MRRRARGETSGEPRQQVHVHVTRRHGARTAGSGACPEAGIERILVGRVMIVEDERDNQDLMRTVIQDLLGGEAVVCGDGERAVSRRSKIRPR